MSFRSQRPAARRAVPRPADARARVWVTLLVLTLLAPFALAGAVAPAAAEITAAADGKRKINLAGRQRMLSQYMAKSACFIALGVDAKREEQELMLAHHLFDQTLSDLRTGSNIQEMLPERDPAILAALDVVVGHWKVYGPAVVARTLDAVEATNLDVLNSANDVVSLLQKKYGASGATSPQVAAAINFAGRQRMLVQKSSKEFCLVASGRDVAANRERLRATVQLFDRSMKALREGDTELGTAAPETGTVLDQIEQATAKWQPLKAIFDRVAAGETASAADIGAVSARNVLVMQEMNTLVDLYESLGD